MGHAFVRDGVETRPRVTSISVHLHDENTTEKSREIPPRPALLHPCQKQRGCTSSFLCEKRPKTAKTVRKDRVVTGREQSGACTVSPGTPSSFFGRLVVAGGSNHGLLAAVACTSRPRYSRGRRGSKPDLRLKRPATTGKGERSLSLTRFSL